MSDVICYTSQLHWSDPSRYAIALSQNAASAARRVALFAIVSALHDAGDRWPYLQNTLCAPVKAGTALVQPFLRPIHT